jgi:hypothetical protein
MRLPLRPNRTPTKLGYNGNAKEKKRNNHEAGLDRKLSLFFSFPTRFRSQIYCNYTLFFIHAATINVASSPLHQHA